MPASSGGDPAEGKTPHVGALLYTGLPFFQRLFRTSGFAAEADQMERVKNF
jgi:hypothetical protein